MTTSDRSRRWWFDARFAVGLVLVVASVGGVLWVVSSADTSVHIYSARASLSPGDRIHSDDLVDETVRLPAHAGRYLAVDDVPKAGLVVTRAVGAGELVPLSAVGAGAGVRVTSLVVPVTGRLARSIEAGAVVDVWSAPSTGDGSFGAPAVLVSSATVVRVVASDGLVPGDGATAVELLVPRTRTARVLEAVANSAAMSLVPSSIPVGG